MTLHTTVPTQNQHTSFSRLVVEEIFLIYLNLIILNRFFLLQCEELDCGKDMYHNLTRIASEHHDSVSHCIANMILIYLVIYKL